MSNRELRDFWTFSYSAADVSDAAQRRADYHAERLKHWEGARDELEKKIRAEGIEFNSRVRPGQMSNTGYRNQPVLARDMIDAHNDAQERVSFHTTAQRSMEGFARVLRVHSAEQVDLTVEDVLHFHLADTEE